ncbi:conserved protein of unknown function [Pseudomonas marincola]|uniref:Uncharacterized protein n=1 Tax=Pseudomonas marincola TaxID=437900 RepID=A0A653DYM0_9PSED|nr:conserved protein of unknown function [Pseudomonas marincola]
MKGRCPRPLDEGDKTFKLDPFNEPIVASLTALKRLVELDGIEPSTSCMPCKRSPS